KRPLEQQLRGREREVPACVDRDRHHRRALTVEELAPVARPERLPAAVLRDPKLRAFGVAPDPDLDGARSVRLVREPMSIGGQSETSLEVGRRHDVANRSATGRNGQNLLTLDTV